MSAAISVLKGLIVDAAGRTEAMEPATGRRVFRPTRALLVVTATCTFALGTAAGMADASADPAPPSVPAGPEVVGTVNEFIPENANLSDCVGSLPRPDCGSDARGGWRQTLLFAVIVAILVVIGVRLAFAVRRRDEQVNVGSAPEADAAEELGVEGDDDRRQAHQHGADRR
jgi:hypothetical protein